MHSRFSLSLWCLLLLGYGYFSVGTCFAESRSFEVRDSIAMVRFTGPLGSDRISADQRSPDGRYCWIVTSRGIATSNSIESTLWLIDLAAVRRYLQDGNRETESTVSPRLLARVVAVPSIPVLEDYSSTISDIRWGTNSRSLFFLGLNSRSEKRLYQIDLSSKKVRPISPVGVGVRQYDISGDTIAFTAISTQRSVVPLLNRARLPVTGDVTPVTGEGISTILFPDQDNGIGLGEDAPDLWVESHGRCHRIIDPSYPGPVRDSEHPDNVLSLSPDGTKTVQLSPLLATRPEWSQYEPRPGFEYRRINPTDGALLAPSNMFRLRQYRLTDNRTGKSQILIDAPSGSSLAEEDRSLAVWSRDGRRVLVGNTTLPLTRVSPAEREARRHSCALAAVDIPSLKSQCIVYTRDASSVIAPDNPKPERLQGAAFGFSNDDVILRFSWHGQWGQTEHYSYRAGTWHIVDIVPGDPVTGSPSLSAESTRQALDGTVLTIRQDLNQPPVLWATDRGSGLSKALWDPNPQFQSMQFGKASVYEWRDSSGYIWNGVLVTPPNYAPNTRYPLVIQTHGFSKDNFITDGSFPTAMAARELASVGIVVLQMGWRIDHFATALEASDQVAGYKAAINQLDRDCVIDPHRVGIIGFSRTALHVEESLIEHPGMFAAATVADGLDLGYMQYRLFVEGRPSLGGEFEKMIGSTPIGEGWQQWLLHSPSFHFEKIDTPLRIEAIGPSSILTEWELYATLRQTHTPVDMVYFPKGQHILQKPLERFASEQGNVEWFQFWLKGYEDPSPSKRPQYDRWRQLKTQWLMYRK